MDAVAIPSLPDQTYEPSPSLFNDEEKRLFILLRYVLIIAASYLFLFEGKTDLPFVSIYLVAMALASNVVLTNYIAKRSLTSFTVGLIVIADIAWIVLGLWYKGGLEADIYVVYFFILLLAAMGQNLKLVVGAGLLLSGVDMTFLALTENHELIWTSSSLIRMPFIFVVSVFYGYIADKIKREHQTALMEQALAERMARVVYNQLTDLRETAEDLQKSYDQLKAQAAELERSNKAKDEFLNVVSHELRTPLSLISGYAEMIRTGMMGAISAEQQRGLVKIKRYTLELLDIVNSILETTQVEAGATRLLHGEVSVSKFLDGIKLIYDMPSDKDVTLKWEYRADLPVVHTDVVKLKSILVNLINNAIKFTESGQVLISARHLPENGTIEFKVTDTGVGIPRDAIPFIFDKFHQADGSQTRAYGGVGLGLHIVKKYSELLGATIEVESVENAGSTFTLTLSLLPRGDARNDSPPLVSCPAPL